MPVRVINSASTAPMLQLDPLAAEGVAAACRLRLERLCSTACVNVFSLYGSSFRESMKDSHTGRCIPYPQGG